ncbi:CoA transferase [Mycolicibacterium sp.]|uniref:CaiB/BaiF CoA transferase family protein n=1 Tax=Mycolicibacterium sp. TaxID=2320850 RepID=UPI001A2B397F|nr:CoA transferase [Mycolicibacterium sp.]MBJ7337135.1 CoA transferase [Mycolicibacterium sp.]
MTAPAEVDAEVDDGLPLRGVRVIDLTDGAAASSTRFLAELGADVILVEPPEGVASRRAHPRHDDIGLPFLTAHANKRGVVLDLTTKSGRDDFLKLVGGADIVVESMPPGRLDDLGVAPTLMRSHNPALVVVSVSHFGQSGPYRQWRADEAVHAAMSSVLTRSGAADREPLLPPGPFTTEAGAVQAAFATLLAYYCAQQTGTGAYVDCALHDMAVQGLDPGFGMAGTATMGRPLSKLPPGRPDARMLYPIFECIDGHVRLCLLAPKHWRAMFTWLGEPAEFADPSYEQLATRIKSWDTLRDVIAKLFADETRDDIVTRAGELGIPIASLNTAAEAACSDHATARRSFVDVEVTPGLTGRVPNGYLEIGGRRAGFRFRAPTLGEHPDRFATDGDDDLRTVASKTTSAEPVRPLSGLRVLDLGVIVVGAETGRLLADQGAEVIKVENRAFMDGARQADTPTRVSHPFSVGNRNKLSLGLNLRDPHGVELFRELIATSDVVLSNFKPGTMESLGLGDDVLRTLNPGIIVVESSAFGSSGPWSNRMGYGPLVRAAVGLTSLWRHPDSPSAFGDDMTIYPDHAAARVAVTAIIAALIDRRRTGTGTSITVAQMETVFAQLGTAYLRESLQPGTMVARGNVGEFDAPTGIYRCRGEDAYCAMTVDGDTDWIRLANTIGRSDLADRPDLATPNGRIDHRDEIDRAVEEWSISLDPRDAAARLQAAGVAAGAAAHVKDLLDDPQLVHRHAFTRLPQPGWDDPLTVETGIALFDAIETPQMNPAPVMAQDTRTVCRTILKLDDAAIDQLARDGVLALPQEGPT